MECLFTWLKTKNFVYCAENMMNEEDEENANYRHSRNIIKNINQDNFKHWLNLPQYHIFLLFYLPFSQDCFPVTKPGILKIHARVHTFSTLYIFIYLSLFKL